MLDLDAHRKRRKQKVKPRPRIVTLLRRARYFQHLLDTNHVTTRTQIAHREGLTRARVTQILNLLKLAPDIQEAILALPRGTPERLVTEHQLRPLIPLDHEAQMARFQEKWGLLPSPTAEKQAGRSLIMQNNAIFYLDAGNLAHPGRDGGGVRNYRTDR